MNEIHHENTEFALLELHMIKKPKKAWEKLKYNLT